MLLGTCKDMQVHAVNYATRPGAFAKSAPSSCDAARVVPDC